MMLIWSLVIDCANATVWSVPVSSTYRSYYHQWTVSHQLWPFESLIFWLACALYASFNFNFAQLCFARFLYFFGLLFSLSRSFFASNFFARGRTFSRLSDFLFCCFP